MASSSESSNCLVILLETNPVIWSKISEDQNSLNPDLWKNLINSLAFFVKICILTENNLHLIFVAVYKNIVEVIVDSKKLHAENKLKAINRHYLSEIHDQILLKLEDFWHKMNSIQILNESKSLFEIQLAMVKTLCYLNKNYSNYQITKTPTRILVIKKSSDESLQYLSFMNCAFGAHKLNINIDGISVGNRSLLLQQAAKVTQSNYSFVEDVKDVPSALSKLLKLDDIAGNESLNTVDKDSNIDHRASCFCHQKIIDKGFACSVCFSIFCKRIPLCLICGTSFPKK